MGNSAPAIVVHHPPIVRVQANCAPVLQKEVQAGHTAKVVEILGKDPSLKLIELKVRLKTAFQRWLKINYPGQSWQYPAAHGCRIGKRRYV